MALALSSGTATGADPAIFQSRGCVITLVIISPPPPPPRACACAADMYTYHSVTFQKIISIINNCQTMKLGIVSWDVLVQMYDKLHR